MATRLNGPDASGVLHFVTLNVRERKRPFARPEYAHMALEALRFECDRHPALLVAYVVMPDHLHCLLSLEDGRLSRFLGRYKPNVTRNLDALLQAEGRVKAREWLASKGGRELWQDGKHSLPLFSPEWTRQRIAYIHDNPVRAGLVEHPSYYEWSSLGAYEPGAVEPPIRVDVWEG